MTGRPPIITVSSRVVAACTAALVVASTAPRLRAADDIWQQTRAMYAALNSYADTGVVLYEYAASSQDRHTFTTSFSRAPRHFYFDFKKAGGDRYVIWGDPEAFHTWWQTTGVQDDYPNPNNIGAFSTAGHHTLGAAMKIPLLLYFKAPLQGAFTNFTDPELDGTEEVGGHRCHRLIGSTRDVYTATGNEVNVRKLTVWIDTESLLIRKVLEQWKALPGQISRATTTFEPQANPALDDSRFRFTPPAPQ
jgi:outer membrane lipoprotein-sorting protein